MSFPPRSSRPAAAALAVTLALIGGGALISVVHFGFDLADTLDAASYAGFLVGMSVIGLLIARREPANSVGWLFSLAPLLVSVSLTFGAIGIAAGPEHRDWSWAPLPAWLSQWAWPLGLIGFAVLMPLLFPDGRPPSGRWRLLVKIDLVVIAATAVLLATQPGEIDGGVINPVGVQAAGAAPVIGAVVVAIVAAMIAGFVSAVVRYRRADPTQRVQLRECLFAVCLTFAGFVLITLVSANEFLYTIDYALIPASVGLAMLRYRLYDVDLVIRRTLVYALLVAGLAAVYLAGIGLFGMTLRAAAGIEGSFAVTLSTLAVAAAFHPFRRRIQHAVDRRFSRAAYDAQTAIEAFAGELRQQIDLDVLSDRLLETVRETVRPRTAGVWLAPVTIPERQSGRTEA
jgi:hypothetical protein